MGIGLNWNMANGLTVMFGEPRMEITFITTVPMSKEI